ncbi:MAG: hypothetical protein K9G26_10210 [Emcibacter sp.]|nr:hypothetical protein [Emcibacter sp.]
MLGRRPELRVLEIKSDIINSHQKEGSSFKSKRKARKICRQQNHLKKLINVKNSRSIRGREAELYSGPTAETLAKLMPDPLIKFRRNDILNDQQIWSFTRIRRAIQIITDGTQTRTSRYGDVVVQTSHGKFSPEADFDIKIKEYYSNWVDRMNMERLQVGPVLDIIIDELSLSAVDRKWGKRKGWAKRHLQSSLELYGVFFDQVNRYK